MELRPIMRNLVTATAIGLGVAACGGNVEDEHVTPKTETQTEGQFKVTHTYQDGQRISYTYSSRGNFVAVSYAYCDGGDLRELDDYGYGGGDIRSVGHTACTDGQLTPEDFTMQQTATPSPTRGDCSHEKSFTCPD